MKTSVRCRHAFTLVELLIVIGILGILAVIAVPNLLEAQTRARVARARADMAALATAIETYAVDQSGYPLNGALEQGGASQSPQMSALGAPAHKFLHSSITTPIPYLPGQPQDLTAISDPLAPSDWHPYLGYYFYTNLNWFHALAQPAPPPVIDQMRRAYGPWILAAAGPDGDRRDLARHLFYDPTNGTVSDGDLVIAPRIRP